MREEKISQEKKLEEEITLKVEELWKSLCTQYKVGKKTDSQRPVLVIHKHKQKATGRKIFNEGK